MLEARNISKTYSNNTLFGLKNIFLKIQPGHITALVGVSGSGKSTLMKIFCGLLDPDSGIIIKKNHFIMPNAGELLVAGYDEVRYVPQNFELFPNHNTLENIHIHFQKVKKTFDHHYTEKILKKLKIKALSDVRVKYLSGGEQQRVALACALCTKPAFLVLDEPFSHLDTHIRAILTDFIRNICKIENIGVLMSAHDAKDILFAADDIAVLQNGKIVQHDCPQNVYYYPKNKHVAGLLGEYNTLKINGSGQKYFRPEQIQFDANGDYTIEIHESLFCGNYYRNTGKHEESIVIAYTSSKMSVGKHRFNIDEASRCSL